MKKYIMTAALALVLGLSIGTSAYAIYDLPGETPADRGEHNVAAARVAPSSKTDLQVGRVAPRSDLSVGMAMPAIPPSQKVEIFNNYLSSGRGYKFTPNELQILGVQTPAEAVTIFEKQKRQMGTSLTMMAKYIATGTEPSLAELQAAGFNG